MDVRASRAVDADGNCGGVYRGGSGGRVTIVIVSRRLRTSVDRDGVEFPYHGDSVIWLWPWRRTRVGGIWLSISWECEFDSLREIDQAWEDFQEACNRAAKIYSDRLWDHFAGEHWHRA